MTFTSGVIMEAFANEVEAIEADTASEDIEHGTIPGAIAPATAPWAIRRSSLHPIDLEKYD